MLYTPEKKIALDEAMCPWRGRLRFKVYIKNKPNKWGIKLYEVCESSSAYVFNFEIYAAEPNVSNKPRDVVNRLLEPLINKGYWVYCDSYNTSTDLVSDLAAKKTMFVGTVQKNRRGLPRELMLMNIKKGESVYRRKGPIVALKWKDKREVQLLTSCLDPRLTQTVTTRTGETVKPTIVADYSNNMAGVDQSDQFLAYVPLNRRSLKWWRKLFLHLMTLSITQGAILHRKLQRSKGQPCLKLNDYILHLMKELTSVYMVNQAALPQAHLGDSAHPGETRRLLDRHFPMKIPSTAMQKNARRRCKVCIVKQKSRNMNVKGHKGTMTSVMCEQCEIPLCLDECFKAFHTIEKYWI